MIEKKRGLGFWKIFGVGASIIMLFGVLFGFWAYFSPVSFNNSVGVLFNEKQVDVYVPEEDKVPVGYEAEEEVKVVGGFGFFWIIFLVLVVGGIVLVIIKYGSSTIKESKELAYLDIIELCKLDAYEKRQFRPVLKHDGMVLPNVPDNYKMEKEGYIVQWEIQEKKEDSRGAPMFVQLCRMFPVVSGNCMTYVVLTDQPQTRISCWPLKTIDDVFDLLERRQRMGYSLQKTNPKEEILEEVAGHLAKFGIGGDK